jgi:hypothetical protein
VHAGKIYKEALFMAVFQDENCQKTLDDWFVDFALTVLNQMTHWTASETVPLIRYQQSVFGDGSSWTQQIVEQKDYQQLLNRHRDEISSIKEAQQCGYEHWQAGILKLSQQLNNGDLPPQSLTSEQSAQLVDFLLYPVLDLLQRYNTLSLTREQILESYRRFREPWIATTVRADAIIPLLNFQANLQHIPVSISTNYSISSFPPVEKTAVWRIVDAFHSWDLLPFHSYLAAGFKLEGSRTYPRLQSDQSQKTMEDIARSHQMMLTEVRNIVTALRLFKAGDVGVTAYIEKSTEVPPFGGYPSMGIPGAGMSDFQVRRHGSVYILDETEVSSAKLLVEALQQLEARPHRGGLEVALSRFNQSYSRDFFEDRLIDLAIALESCLLAMPNTKTELRYRFALRGAALLAKDRNPSETNRLLLTLYDARSAIVHEGKYLSEQKKKDKYLAGHDPREFVQVCEDIVREILRGYIGGLINAGSQSSVSKVNERLEQQILKGLIASAEDQ